MKEKNEIYQNNNFELNWNFKDVISKKIQQNSYDIAIIIFVLNFMLKDKYKIYLKFIF